MRVRSPERIDAGRAVKIEMGDAMFLGEVCYCAAAPGDDPKIFNLGIATKQCLTGLASLHHLIRALSPEGAPELERTR